MDVGREIRRLRESKGWSQAKLAGDTGMGVSGISQIETGARNPSAATLWKIAEALGVGVGDLFAKAPAPPPLEELAAGGPLLENVLHAARQDANKSALAANRLFASEGIPQSLPEFAEDEVRAELRNLGFPDAFFEDLLWPLAERVTEQERRIIELERELEAKEGEPAERLGTDTRMRQ